MPDLAILDTTMLRIDGVGPLQFSRPKSHIPAICRKRSAETAFFSDKHRRGIWL
jgi:hypothetical protein